MKFIFQNIKWIIITIIFLAAVSLLAFNENGIAKYFSLKKEVNKLNSEIDRVDKENKSLQFEIDSLQRKVPAKIEKTAREKYGMIRKGETAVEIRQK